MSEYPVLILSDFLSLLIHEPEQKFCYMLSCIVYVLNKTFALIYRDAAAELVHTDALEERLNFTEPHLCRSKQTKMNSL